MDSNTNYITAPGRLLSIKTMLVPLLTHPRVAHFIKYTVYLSLAVNFFIYFHDDYLAMHSALPADAPVLDLLTRFSTSIDMAAWLGLIVLFELETYALPDEAFTKLLTALLRAGRVLCYVSIFSAAFGYTAEAMQTYHYTGVAGISGACQLADQEIWLQIDSIEYQEITALNCDSVSTDQAFYQFEGDSSVIGASLLPHVQLMGWIDISNAFVWLFVVALIEVELWLQSADRYSSRLLYAARQAKTLFYLVLIGNGVVWAINGYALYAWDAFLWIFGFWAIELNLAEWEVQRLAEMGGAEDATPAR